MSVVYTTPRGYCYSYIDGVKRRISKQQYQDIIDGELPTVEEISQNVTKYIDYPYLRYLVPEEKLASIFEALKIDNLTNYICNYNMSRQNTKLDKAKRLIMTRAFITGYAYEVLMEYFQEDARNKCNREGYPSPWDVYINPEYNVQWVKEYYHNILQGDVYSEDTIRSLRKTIYKKNCDAFPANLALWLMNKWKPKKILMMCGAWGDEIIATMAYGQHTLLTAVDPNKAAVENWYDMINYYDPENVDKYKFHIKPFEEVVLTPEESGFDLMYSSPPYFTAEHYSEDEGQSYLKFRTREDWLVGFLRPSLEKVWALMNFNGVVVLALNDVIIDGVEVRLVQPMHDIMDSFQDSKYIGTYGFKKMKSQKNYQPLFCWKKQIQKHKP
jgi:hypothetical protein